MRPMPTVTSTELRHSSTTKWNGRSADRSTCCRSAGRGTAAVLELIERLVPEVFQVFCFVPSSMLVDGDQVATLNRLWAKRSDDGRVISYRLAHFVRFRDGKVVENLSLIDSFDAVEQVLGHPLAVHDSRPREGDLV